MNFRQLLDSVTWPEVKAAILWAYPDEENALGQYKVLLAKLKQMQPIPSEMRIVLELSSVDAESEKPAMDVIGRDGSLNRDREDFPLFRDSLDASYADAETNWALSFRPWEEWLGMQIDAGTLKNQGASQIIAHCLWDMTFHGFDQTEIRETLEEIERRADEVKAMTEEEREKRLIPADEVLRRLRSDNILD